MNAYVIEDGRTTAFEILYSAYAGSDPKQCVVRLASGPPVACHIYVDGIRKRWFVDSHSPDVWFGAKPLAGVGELLAARAILRIGAAIVLLDPEPLTPPEPLAPVERELLDRIANGDDDARRVIADHWLGGRDEARGMLVQIQTATATKTVEMATLEQQLLESQPPRWHRELLLAGFSSSDLVVERGFLRTPLVLGEGEPLDRWDAVFRNAPLYYREPYAEYPPEGVIAARAVTAAGEQQRVAIKVTSHYAADMIAHEMAHLTRFDHPNLPHVRGAAVRRHGAAFVMDWAGVDLGVVLARAGVLEPAFAISVGLQLCDAAAALGTIVHAGMKPGHVLVDDTGNVTLVDFRNAHSDIPLPAREQALLLDPEYDPPVRLDELRHWAPEAIRNTSFTRTPAANVYQIGMLLGELLAGRPLVPGNQLGAIAVAIIENSFTLPPLPPVITTVLRAVLAPEPQARPLPRDLHDELVLAARALRIDVGPHIIAATLRALGVSA